MVYFARWKIAVILCICGVGVFFAIPSFLSPQTLEKLPSWFPKAQVSLGLDLQGGSHLLLEVDLHSALQDRLEFVLDDIRKTFRKERIRYVDLRHQRGVIVFKLKDPQEAQKVLVLLKSVDSRLEITEKPSSFLVSFSEKEKAESERNILMQSIEIVNRRINELGTREPNIQRHGHNRIIVELPGVNDPSRVKRLLGKTAKLAFRLLHPDFYSAKNLTTGVPADAEILSNDERRKEPKESRVEEFVVLKHILLTGEHLVDARVSFNPTTNAPEVSFTLSVQGGRKFGEITQNNIGRHLAIVLDDKVISAPVINGPIPGGRGVITGHFSVEEANDLALLMRAGSLPAPLKVVEERTVGPDLGADSITAGKRATIYSLLLIAAFMAGVYLLFGFFANIALVFNLIFLIAALAVTGSTLTLPGVAGIALTMGMAVDANVLIYERIREELRLGRKIFSAVDAGYKRAMATIWDSNLTTLIAAGALCYFGSGPIRGFGVTLTFGIVISMFTAISLTRLMAVMWFRAFKPKHLPI